jgi:hypothetical protein
MVPLDIYSNTFSSARVICFNDKSLVKYQKLRFVTIFEVFSVTYTRYLTRIAALSFPT